MPERVQQSNRRERGETLRSESPRSDARAQTRPKKIAVIMGTRPEVIKLAPVVLQLKHEPGIQCQVCATAQHRQLLDQALRDFNIISDIDLNLMKPGQTLAELTARALTRLDKYFAAERPDLILVQGDTTTVFCSALMAFYHQLPLGHVEAGLRTWNLSAPWPEEANRVLTSQLAQLHFAPTKLARENLLKGGVPAKRITVTGNTVIDALFLALDKVRKNPPRIPQLPDRLQPGAFGSEGASRLVLITGHRRENFGPAFESVCYAIAELGRLFPDVDFVYPIHPNPNVREPVLRILGQNAPDGAEGVRSGNLHLIDPLGYLPFVALMDCATLLLTDSGGIQEEAPSLKKPVLVMRDTTERPEAVAAGTARLVGTDRRRIVSEVARLLNDRSAYQQMVQKRNPYGDGRASARIVTACRQFLES